MPRAISKIIDDAAPRPVVELSDKQIAVLKNTGQVILALAAVAGALTIGAAAPGVFKVLNKTSWSKRRYSGLSQRERTKRQKRDITKAYYYLKETGKIQIIPQGNDHLIKIKDKGRKVIKKLNFENLKIGKSEKWDGKYWVVLADIPVKYRYYADLFHAKLKQMKLYPLQRTVWFYPHDPRDEIDFVSSYWRIGRFVTVMKIDFLSSADETKLREFFEANDIF